MKKMLKIVALLSVMIGNLAIFQSNANALVSVDGYFRSNGTYVAPHFRTSPDSFTFNNFVLVNTLFKNAPEYGGFFLNKMKF